MRLLHNLSFLQNTFEEFFGYQFCTSCPIAILDIKNSVCHEITGNASSRKECLLSSLILKIYSEEKSITLNNHLTRAGLIQ
ncbi:hypothetical protein V1478_009185 [Vespula squamosa]|uniref:Uncharacterized protein n=1 Tax=Vespula squamosa TaxID=30214 RepID=A0ABD2ANY1_VESSQ